MTLNGAIALILRYFTEFGGFRAALRKIGWRRRRKKVHVRYLISWWVSCNKFRYKCYLKTGQWKTGLFSHLI